MSWLTGCRVSPSQGLEAEDHTLYASYTVLDLHESRPPFKEPSKAFLTRPLRKI
jgi:hypothetical protein